MSGGCDRRTVWGATVANTTRIAWTDSTLNGWLGCFKVSQGCTHCYADALTKGRMGLTGQKAVFGHPRFVQRKRTSPRTWAQAVKWNRHSPAEHGRPTRVFCGSLMDFFEDAEGPNAWRKDLWGLIRATPWLDWQLLTKRPQNVTKMLPDDWDTAFSAGRGLAGRGRDWRGEARLGEARQGWPHVWLGVSVEDNRVADRVPILTSVPAHVHFISYEPAIGPGDQIPLEHVEWVIYGGESGPKHRKHDITWALEMWARCQNAGIAYFYKQGNGPRSDMNIDELGQVVREFPVSWNREEMTNAARLWPVS